MEIPQGYKTLLRIFFLLFSIYLFFLSITLLGNSLKFLGEGFAENLMITTSSPFIGLFIGILCTSIIQSSSTTTCILIGIVSGGAISVENAIYIVMGANIGTTVTNGLVSLAHISRNQEFRRAFSASVVHDFFNIMAVIIIFPFQYFTNFLGKTAGYLGNLFENAGGLKFANPIKVITEPVNGVIENLASQNGILLIIISLFILFFALRNMVKTIKKLVIDKVENLFDKVIFNTPIRAFLFGLVLTAVVQSSSITISLVIPLAGAGVLTLYQVFPYALGANLGTTVTALLAACASNNISAIVVAFAHLIFNFTGILVIYPFRKIPIFLAKKFAEKSTEKKYFVIAYIITLFFIIPVLLIYLF
ncbi:Na/Pi symporter [candidate division KSB1 bacterium]